MSDAKENFVVPFLGALQASIAVLLTIFAGVLAAQFNLVSEASAKDISKFCVRLSLPALLIVNVGKQLQQETALQYVRVLVWSLFYNIASMLFGLGMTKVMKLPQWVTPAMSFNNTTSLPLLLIQSLDATGILASLDASPDVVDRAKSYFLVNAMVSNSLTFALGPRLLNGHDEDAPEKSDDDDASDHNPNGDAEAQAQDEEEEAISSSEQANEETSLLPDRVVDFSTRKTHQASKRSHALWSRLPPWLQSTLTFLYQFCNAPLIGALIGTLLGLVPSLHTLFFAEQTHGGYLNAWLTSAVKNVGDLFASLQVIVVGVKLARAMLKYKNGEASGSVPWRPFALITFVRFIFWPLVSIPLIYILATRTSVLAAEPMLWFAMMLMPTGPPAMKIMALADVSGAGEEEKMSIAKFLTISYAVSPLICFSVVGALKASQAAVGK